jgi:shikimate kinase
MKIYLVGMPGSGKSTLGKKLAQQLMMTFVDLDLEIEKFANRSIPEIFIESGEDYFREIESRLLSEWAASQSNFVMATGGGTPCYFHGMEIINKSGFSIFLNVPMKELLRRVEEESNRPLLADTTEREATLRKLFETRLPCYQKANLTISDPDLLKLMEAIHFRS